MSDSDSSDGDFSEVLKNAAVSDGESLASDDSMSESEGELLDLPNTDDDDSESEVEEVEPKKKLVLKQAKIKQSSKNEKSTKTVKQTKNVATEEKPSSSKKSSEEKQSKPTEEKSTKPSKPTEEKAIKSSKPSEEKAIKPGKSSEEKAIKSSKSAKAPKVEEKVSTAMDIESPKPKKKRKAVEQPEQVEPKKVKEDDIYIDFQGEVVSFDAIVRQGDNKSGNTKTEHKHITYVKGTNGAMVACLNSKQWPEHELLEISIDKELAAIKAASGRKRCIFSQLVKAEADKDPDTVKAFTNESSSHFIVFSDKAKASTKKSVDKKPVVKATVSKVTSDDPDFNVTVSFNFKSDKAASDYLKRITSNMDI